MKTFMWRFKGNESVGYRTVDTYKNLIDTLTKQYGIDSSQIEVVGYMNDNGIWVSDSELIEMCMRGEL